MTDAIEEWTAAQRRVVELVTGLTPDQAATKVPACPDWTVRNLLSHMVGLGTDVLAGDEPDDHNSEWTQRQVDERADRDIPALVAEWNEVAAALPDWMRENGARPLGDVIIHEQDLRGALRAPGAQDTPGLAQIRDTFTERFAGQLDGLPPIALVGPDWQWVSEGAVPDAAVLLRADTFELTRALLSRRSEGQLRRWTERGEITPYLDAFAMLGDLPSTDMSESSQED